MPTNSDQDFIRYWEAQRLKKKSFLRKLYFGLPLGVLLVAATLVSLLSGWYKKADQELHADTSVIIVVLIAGLGIVIFITLFSARYKWEQNEQHYRELLYRQNQSVQQNPENEGQTNK
jgi:F0F1-type ATP synthase assembly protein I